MAILYQRSINRALSTDSPADTPLIDTYHTSFIGLSGVAIVGEFPNNWQPGSYPTDRQLSGLYQATFSGLSRVAIVGEFPNNWQPC
jgi:hypothetical protein